MGWYTPCCVAVLKSLSRADAARRHLDTKSAKDARRARKEPLRQRKSTGLVRSIVALRIIPWAHTKGCKAFGHEGLEGYTRARRKLTAKELLDKEIRAETRTPNLPGARSPWKRTKITICSVIVQFLIFSSPSSCLLRGFRDRKRKDGI